MGISHGRAVALVAGAAGSSATAGLALLVPEVGGWIALIVVVIGGLVLGRAYVDAVPVQVETGTFVATGADRSFVYFEFVPSAGVSAESRSTLLTNR